MAKNDDLISRGKALEDLRDIKEMLVAAGDPFLANIMLRAISCIENQPAVEVVRPTLPKMVSFALRYVDSARCPKCIDDPENQWNAYGKMNYCPNCGRKAVKEEQPGGKD